MQGKYTKIIFKLFKDKNYTYLLKQALKFLKLKFSPVVKKRLTSPLIATLITTYHCNSQCLKCIKQGLKKDEPELKTKDFKALIDDLKNLKVSGISFTGGEPLLRTDIIELFEYAVSKKLFVHLSTNGYLLDAETSERILKTGLDSINISLDSADSAKMAQVTGVNDSLSLVCQGIANIVAARKKLQVKVELGVVTILNFKSFEEFEAVVTLAKKLGVDGLALNLYHVFPQTLEKAKENISQGVILDKIIKYQKRDKFIENSSAYLKLSRKFFKGEPLPFCCKAGYNFMVIDPYGQVFPCFVWQELGNNTLSLKGRKISEVIFSPEYEALTKQALSCRSCYWHSYQENNLLFRAFLR